MQMMRLMLNTLNRVAVFLGSEQDSLRPDRQNFTLEKIKLECDFIFRWLMKTHPIHRGADHATRTAIVLNMLYDACVLFKANIYDRATNIHELNRIYCFSAFLRWVWYGSNNQLTGKNLKDYIPPRYRSISSYDHDMTILDVNTSDKFISFVERKFKGQ
jgi:hypothetical protein